MLNWLSWKLNHNRTAVDIYGSIVAAARQKTFYDPWGVPDSREGRIEMVMLHVALVMLRLGAIGPTAVALSRAVAEAFITDMDDNMREIGIGDLAVPRKIKRAAAALYDRHRDYGSALSAGDHTELADALRAAISSGSALPHLDCDALARYTERFATSLGSQTDAQCLAGQLPPLQQPAP